MTVSIEELRDRFVGSLLGTHVGDSLGMPVEGFSMDRIRGSFGLVNDLLDSRLGIGTYTDDTQMMIGVAESLIEHPEFNGHHMAWRFIRNFDITRGYGPVTVQTLLFIRKGTPWNRAGEMVFPEGSYGNGSSMRVAPVGLLFSGDTERLMEMARSSSIVTHTHPVATCGARLQAFSVARALSLDRNRPVDENRETFLRSLVDISEGLVDPFPERIAIIREFLENEPDDDEIVDRLGNNVVSVNSVPTAIYCALRNLDDFRRGVLMAVNLGGDTDTIGAMTGAILGAYAGAGSIPPEWLGKLENGTKGRDYITGLAERLLDVKGCVKKNETI